jgi:hypothetical protein
MRCQGSGIEGVGAVLNVSVGRKERVVAASPVCIVASP